MFKDIKALFFENTGIKQTILKNTFWLASAELVSRLLESVLFIYIIWILGALDFGKFAFALAFVAIFAASADFGLSDITVREISNNEGAKREYPAVLSLKLVLSLIVLILILATSFLITPSKDIRFAIWILGLSALIHDFLFIFYAFFRAYQKMELEAGFKIIRVLILAPIVFFILLKRPSINSISYGYLFANLLSLVLISLFFYFKIQPFKLIFDKSVWQKFFRFCWPLGMATIMGAILLSIDSVIMGYFNQIIETGWYNASRKIVGVIIIPASFIYMSFYPSLGKIFKKSKDTLQRVWNFYMKLMIVLSLPIVAGGFLLAPQIIKFIFGLNSTPSIIAFQILIFIAGINFLCYPYILILIVSGQQKKYLWVNLVAVVTNITLNFILIPRYSLYGASVSAVITYAVLFLLSLEFSRRFTCISVFNLDLLKILILSFFASTVMALIINQMSANNIDVLINVFTGILIYFFVLFLAYKFKNLWNRPSKLLNTRN